jgi:hypothetical protein
LASLESDLFQRLALKYALFSSRETVSQAELRPKSRRGRCVHLLSFFSLALCRFQGHFWGFADVVNSSSWA